jgi:hypothetical protein
MQFAPISTNYSEEGTHVVAPKGKKLLHWFQMHIKREKPKLLTPITFNKNGQKSNNNLKIVIMATKAQLLR